MSEINELRKIQDVYSLFSRCMPYVIDYLPHKFFFLFFLHRQAVLTTVKGQRQRTKFQICHRILVGDKNNYQSNKKDRRPKNDKQIVDLQGLMCNL